MATVQTSKGLIERERLTWRDEHREDGDQITTIRSWYLDGEFVRNDVWVSLHRGLGTDVAGGAVPGG